MTEAGSLTQSEVIAALDHARIVEGPGGPAAMVPGQHHVRMNMFIAQARSGRFQIVKNLGAIEPQEPLVAAPASSADEGPFMGMAATGKRIEVKLIDIILFGWRRSRRRDERAGASQPSTSVARQA